jgi:hypothetical protein
MMSCSAAEYLAGFSFVLHRKLSFGNLSSFLLLSGYEKASSATSKLLLTIFQGYPIFLSI